MYTSGWPKNQNRCCHSSGEPPLCQVIDLIGDHQAAGNEEARAGDAVEQQQDARREQHAERQQAQESR